MEMIIPTITLLSFLEIEQFIPTKCRYLSMKSEIYTILRLLLISILTHTVFEMIYAKITGFL